MQSETRANGQVLTFAWDKLNRMTSRSSGGVSEIFTYDVGSHGIGRLTSMSDASGTTNYSYGADGQLVQQVNVIQGQAYTTQWQYWPSGNLKTLVYPNGLALQYAHDSQGRLSRVGSNIANWDTIADSFRYQPATGKLWMWRFGAGQWRGFSMDAVLTMEENAS
jgi:YD repeat-containing protein